MRSHLQRTIFEFVRTKGRITQDELYTYMRSMGYGDMSSYQGAHRMIKEKKLHRSSDGDISIYNPAYADHEAHLSS